MKKKKIRPLGQILLDIEPLVLEMIDDHDLQFGDILGMCYQYLEIHCPDAKEVYSDDGTSPIFYYGPKKD